MTTRAALMALAATLAAGLGFSVDAATPAFWLVASQADFLEGELQGLSIDSDGRLSLGPDASLAGDTAAPMVWQVLAAEDGGVLAATGNDGKVFRIARDGTVSTAFDAAELQVHALAPAPDGGFFAGTSPEGKVYRIGRDGKAVDWFDPEDKYIWALAAARDGTLYVATGEKGVIYRVRPDGTGAVFYKTKATNVISLALDDRGRLLAGTSSPGQLLRIDAEARGFVLLESAFPEVRALRLDRRGNLYAVGVGAGPSEARPSERPATAETTTSTTPVASVSTEVTITAIGDISTVASPTVPSSRTPPARTSARGAIYRVAPDGLWETFWEASEDVPFDLFLEHDGSLLVATGSRGRLLRLSGDPVRVTMVGRADAQQITSIAATGAGQVQFATANPGKVFRLGGGTVSEGTYESDVRDATGVATWGTIRWEGIAPQGSSISLQTRSGNTSTPDDTWSAWSTAYTRAEGETIASPKARFLQWKAVLRGGKGVSPVLTSVTVAYLPRNQRPSVTSITVHPPGVAFARPFPTGEPEIAGFDSGLAEARPPLPASATTGATAAAAPALGRRLYQKGLQTFAWKAEDEPGDQLQYDVSYRRQGDREWIPLRRGMWDAILTWDTTAVPDGTYTIRVVASDAPSNSTSVALQGERESEPFDVDNTAPVVTVAGVRQGQGRTVVAFSVSDGHSPLDRVEYSVDAMRWRMVYPIDGIADSRDERFEVTLEDPVRLPITIRAVDSLNNIGSAVAAAPPPSPPRP